MMKKEVNLPVVHRYIVDLEILPEDVPEHFTQYGGSIKVACKILLDNQTDHHISNIPLLLYRLLCVTEIIEQKGEAVNFTQNIRALKGLSRLQVNNVNVKLSGPIPPMGTGEITVRYEGPICGYQEVWPYVKDHVSKSYTLLRNDVLWYPIVAYPSVDSFFASIRASHFDYVIRTSIDAGSVAVTGGILLRKKSEEEKISYIWQNEESSWRLDVACAPFLKLESGNATIYFLKDHLRGAKVVNRALTRTFELCNKWFATTAKKKLNVVEIPKGYGSQTSPSLILLTGDSFVINKDNTSKAFRNALSRVGHEVIHLWSVPSREKYVSRWLDEGFAHYFEACLLREEFGEKKYSDRLE